MGDYKLKSEASYIVPDHLRVNAMKKRRQLVLLEDSVYSVRMGFNERFLALRDLKRRIIANISQDNLHLQAINTELGCNEPLWQPNRRHRKLQLTPKEKEVLVISVGAVQVRPRFHPTRPILKRINQLHLHLR